LKTIERAQRELKNLEISTTIKRQDQLLQKSNRGFIHLQELNRKSDEDSLLNKILGLPKIFLKLLNSNNFQIL